MNQIKIAIADDHQLFRDGIKILLRSQQEIVLTQEAKNGQELIDKIQQSDLKPDIVLMDIEMPIMGGFQATKELLKILPGCKIIYLSVHDSKYFIDKAIQNNAHGFVSKGANMDELMFAINQVYKDGVYFNEYLNPNRLRTYVDNHVAENSKFTQKERNYIKLLCEQMTDSEIAQEMEITTETAKGYRKTIMKKMGVKKVAGVAKYAMDKNLI